MEDSYVTRKPLTFTLIVLVILLVILTPVYFYTKNVKKPAAGGKGQLITESYAETNYWFSPDSDISEDDKRVMFNVKYKDNYVQWTGNLISCKKFDGAYRVSVTEQNSDFPDVLFTSWDDCTYMNPGTTMTYKIKLIDWKLRSFTGSEGRIIQ